MVGAVTGGEGVTKGLGNPQPRLGDASARLLEVAHGERDRRLAVAVELGAQVEAQGVVKGAHVVAQGGGGAQFFDAGQEALHFGALVGDDFVQLVHGGRMVAAA